MNAYQRILSTLQTVDQYIGSLGCRCIEAEWLAHTGTLRLYIDHAASASPGITHDDCARVSHILNQSEILDEYYPGLRALEVSSPGVERPLRLREDFLRQQGKEIAVSLSEAIEGQMNGQGILREVNVEGLVALEVAGRLWRFPIEKIKKARTIYNW